MRPFPLDAAARSDVMLSLSALLRFPTSLQHRLFISKEQDLQTVRVFATSLYAPLDSMDLVPHAITVTPNVTLSQSRNWTFIFGYGICLWQSCRALFCLDPESRALSDAEDYGPPHDRLVDETNTLMVEIFGPYPVGWGGTSDVWKGRILGSSECKTIVAVKMLRIFADGTKLGKCLHREMEIWRMLHHDNIASFYGVVFNSHGTPALVSPWYENGSADVYLRKNPDVDPMKLVWEIVLGVEYLHQHDIVHGDLKAANVMVDTSGHAKLIDFGFSRIIDTVTGISGGITMTTVAFSVRWCAPELLLSAHAQVTKAADVYAFASTALQLITGEVPYGSKPERSILLTVLNHIPPDIPSTLPQQKYPPNQDNIWDLLKACWQEVSQRPSISVVKDTIQAIYSDSALSPQPLST